MNSSNTETPLRNLLSKSPNRFHTVILDATYQVDSQITGPAMTRHIEARSRAGKKNAIRVTSSRSGIEGSRIQRASTWRIWWRKPGCWRDDLIHGSGGTSVGIVCNGELSHYMSWLGKLHTTRPPVRALDRLKSSLFPSDLIDRRTADERANDIPLLSGSFAATGWELQLIGDRTHCGRKGLLFHARWRDSNRPPTPWGWIDEYRAIVDLERGTLLNCEGIINDQPAIVMSVSSIEFDAPIPDSVFQFEPPAGTRTIWA